MLARSLWVYRTTGWNWWTFAALFLWPDLGMLGYFVNVRLGATLYNLVHTETLPIALAGLGWWLHLPGSLPFAAIWLSHIGWDRMLGYGLKYPTSFKDTHFQRA